MRRRGDPDRGGSHIQGMLATLIIVSSFLSVFLPALGLFVAGLARAAARAGPRFPG